MSLDSAWISFCWYASWSILAVLSNISHINFYIVFCWKNRLSICVQAWQQKRDREGGLERVKYFKRESLSFTLTYSVKIFSTLILKGRKIRIEIRFWCTRLEARQANICSLQDQQDLRHLWVLNKILTSRNRATAEIWCATLSPKIKRSCLKSAW